MKNRIKIISLFVLVILCFSAYETNAFGGPGGRGFAGRHLKWVLAKAGVPLTDEQKTEIKAIIKESRDQSNSERTNLITARRELRELILTGTASEADIQAKVEAMTPLIIQMARKRAQTFNKIAGLLTEDQRAVLQKHSNLTIQ